MKKSLIYFEFKKIASRRMTIIAVLGTVLLSILFFIFTVSIEMHTSYDSEAGRTIQELNGLSAIDFEREEMHELKGYLTKEYINKRKSEREVIENNPANLETIPQEELEQKKNEMKAMGFSEEGIENIRPTRLKEDAYIDEVDKYDFLRSHVGKIERIPNIITELESRNLEGINENRPGKYQGSVNGNLTDKEVNKLLKMYRKVNSTPTYYDYYFGWERLSRNLSFIFSIILSALVVICLSPVFSQESSLRTDAIILTTRYGKNKLITAKLVSSFLFTTAFYLLIAVIIFGLHAAMYGVSGYNSNIQLEFLYYQSPYNLTFLGLNVWVLALGYIGLLFMAAITLFISSKGKSPFIVVVLSALILYIPMIDLSKISYLADKFISLFPVNIMNANENFELGVFYNLFGYPVGQPIVMIGIAVIISMLLVKFTFSSFKNHQV